MKKSQAYQAMKNAENEYNRAKVKLEAYEKYIPILESLNSNSLRLVVYINEATAAFEKGGYNDGGETFDRGVLNSSASNICDTNAKISNVITKTKLKIKDLKIEVEQKYNNWQIAISLYNSCEED